MFSVLVIVSLATSLAFAPSVQATLPLPTSRQLAWQSEGIMALIHFNMATFVQNGDPACDPSNWNVGINSSNPTTFDPTNLNVSNWAVSMKALGIKHSVLTAKHGCGFLLWNTSTTLPDGTPYGYAVQRPNGLPSYPRDVIQEYVDTMRSEGLGYGFYYSTGNNFYLNRRGFVPDLPKTLPGQVNVTDAQFESLVIQHVTELWTQYGELVEIWFDGGFGAAFQSVMKTLLAKHQAQAVAFQGYGVSSNPTRWVGTESGLPSYPLWSNANPSDSNGGEFNGSYYIPAACDTTLQEGDTWFYVPGTPIRTLQELIPIYHATVGSNCVLELDFAIDRTGNVDPKHAARYAQLGQWASSCYGTPAASSPGPNKPITIPSGVTVDRALMREDQTTGERVMSYTILCGSEVVGSGSAVGARRIHLLNAPCMGPNVLTLQLSGVNPVITVFEAFKTCPTQ